MNIALSFAKSEIWFETTCGDENREVLILSKKLYSTWILSDIMIIIIMMTILFKLYLLYIQKYSTSSPYYNIINL